MIKIKYVKNIFSILQNNSQVSALNWSQKTKTTKFEHPKKPLSLASPSLFFRLCVPFIWLIFFCSAISSFVNEILSPTSFFLSPVHYGYLRHTHTYIHTHTHFFRFAYAFGSLLLSLQLFAIC